MLIEQLSDFSVKYTLTSTELAEYGLDFDSISQYDTNTRLMVSHLILLAERQENVSIDFTTSEVYVEVLPCSNGDCVVYLSKIRTDTHRTVGRSDYILCTSEVLDDLVRLCRQLVKFSMGDITSSRLYLKDTTLLLLLELKVEAFEKVLYAVAEFCEYSTKRTSILTLSERCQPLAEYDAVYRLSVL